MSTYISLGKIPKTPEERQELLAKKAAMDDNLSSLELTQVQKRVIDFLICQKGYMHDNIETNKEFSIAFSDVSFNAKADIVLRIEGKTFAVIKCAMNSLESWERHSIAFGRVAEPNQIPYAIVTDSETARVLDASKGALIAEGLDAIPSKEDAQHFIQKAVIMPYPQDKADKEKRILYAFDAITCNVETSAS